MLPQTSNFKADSEFSNTLNTHIKNNPFELDLRSAQIEDTEIKEQSLGTLIGLTVYWAC